jgi:hypothetical protein
MPSPSLRTDRIRVVAFVKRKDEISREEFSRYWREEYAERVMAVPIIQKNLLKYEQVSETYGSVIEGFRRRGFPQGRIAVVY